MRRIRIALWGLLLGLTGLWLLADTLWPQPFGYFPFRGVLLNAAALMLVFVLAAYLLRALAHWRQRAGG